MLKPEITLERAKMIGDELHADWTRIDLEQFRMGLEVELEHGGLHPETNITNDDALMTAKMALAHLMEIPDYYARLSKMEHKAGRYWNRKKKEEQLREKLKEEVLAIRDEIASWKNKLEAVDHRIPHLKDQLSVIDLTGMKKHFTREKDKIGDLFDEGILKARELRERVALYEKNAEHEISKGKRKLRTALLKEKAKLEELLNELTAFFEMLVKRLENFLHDVKSRIPEGAVIW
jgi:chromosome segregation ATPase